MVVDLVAVRGLEFGNCDVLTFAAAEGCRDIQLPQRHGRIVAVGTGTINSDVEVWLIISMQVPDAIWPPLK